MRENFSQGTIYCGYVLGKAVEKQWISCKFFVNTEDYRKGSPKGSDRTQNVIRPGASQQLKVALKMGFLPLAVPHRFLRCALLAGTLRFAECLSNRCAWPAHKILVFREARIYSDFVARRLA